ncbi:hypothetical protein QZH41_004767 [Actinostola sp. cb2023]|nr:hypothetical protein QZH41_004767 [Actinostola sp. cb2023]
MYIAAPASTSRTKGCDEACQKECLDVLNKYRTNHDAPRLQFSQTLADKAQKWADGGKFGYDMDARGKYGQLIEWDVKDELPTFKAVIKHWHDKEKDYDFTKGKSNNGQTLHDFTQVVWKKAHKAGCGRGRMFGSRYYVVWLDADGVISPMLSPEGSKNIGAPKERDLHWFEVTKLTAVGKPLSQNTTNSSEPTNNTSQHHDCCKTSQQKIRTKSSVSPEDEEDINGQENEEQVLNDSNHIKNDMHASLSRVFDEEDKEVANLRDVFGDFW